MPIALGSEVALALGVPGRLEADAAGEWITLMGSCTFGLAIKGITNSAAGFGETGSGAAVSFTGAMIGDMGGEYFAGVTALSPGMTSSGS